MNSENLRRAMSRLAGAGLLALTAATASLPAAESACSAEKPNIILILADDIGWRDGGCFGGTAVPTRMTGEPYADDR
jgi:hypothetical protein